MKLFFGYFIGRVIFDLLLTVQKMFDPTPIFASFSFKIFDHRSFFQSYKREFLFFTSLQNASFFNHHIIQKALFQPNIQRVVTHLSLSYPTPYPRCYLCRCTWTGSQISCKMSCKIFWKTSCNVFIHGHGFSVLEFKFQQTQCGENDKERSYRSKVLKGK